MEKSGVLKNMAQFESVFEDLDVKIEGVTGSLDAVAGASTEDNQAVAALLQQMQADQAMNQGLAVGNVNQAQIQNPNAIAQPAQAAPQNDV